MPLGNVLEPDEARYKETPTSRTTLVLAKEVLVAEVGALALSNFRGFVL